MIGNFVQEERRFRIKKVKNYLRGLVLKSIVYRMYGSFNKNSF